MLTPPTTTFSAPSTGSLLSGFECGAHFEQKWILHIWKCHWTRWGVGEKDYELDFVRHEVHLRIVSLMDDGKQLCKSVIIIEEKIMNSSKFSWIKYIHTRTQTHTQTPTQTPTQTHTDSYWVFRKPFFFQWFVKLIVVYVADTKIYVISLKNSESQCRFIDSNTNQIVLSSIALRLVKYWTETLWRKDFRFDADEHQLLSLYFHCYNLFSSLMSAIFELILQTWIMCNACNQCYNQ